MLYIKCNKCGHLNQFQNDYLTFCSSCNKKLDNNYTSWQKENPKKNKAEYIRLFCISDEEIAERTKNQPKKKSKLAYIIGIVIVTTISASLASLGVSELTKYFKNNIETSEIKEENWKLTSYGSLGLKLEVPFELTSIEVDLPDEIKSLIEVSNNYSYSSISGFTIVVNSFLYSDEVTEFSLEGAANGSINDIKMQAGVSNLDYQLDNIVLNDVPGFKLNGSLENEGVSFNLIIMGYVNGSVFHQVIVIYKSDDSEADKAAKRITSSIIIN